MATPSRNHHYHHPHAHPTAPFTRPAYPAYAAASQFSSASSSAFQSSSSLASLSSSSQAGVMSSQSQAPSSSSSTSYRQHQHQHHTSTAAPLPSPDTTHQPNQYFGSLNPQVGGVAGGQMTTQHEQPVPLQRHSSLERRPDRTGAGAGASAGSETMACLRDYNLVAEAAKRAQMAVLMRDLEGVEL